MRRWIVNEKFFDDIQTEHQAYWLGFIAADGSIQYTKKNKRLEIDLARKDGHHLDKFVTDLGWSGKVRHVKTKSILRIYSKTLVESLMNLGIHPRKSHTLKPWIGPQHLMRHYWRGVFDGDGGFCKHIKKRKTKRSYTAWSSILVGTKDITEAFQQFILAQTRPPYNKGTIRRHSSVWAVTFGGLRPSQSVAVMLYSDATVFLDRKLHIADEILSTQLHKNLIISLELKKEDLLSQYNQFNNWSKVAANLGVSHSGLYKHIRKLGLPRRTWTPNLLGTIKRHVGCP